MTHFEKEEATVPIVENRTEFSKDKLSKESKVESAGSSNLNKILIAAAVVQILLLIFIAYKISGVPEGVTGAVVEEADLNVPTNNAPPARPAPAAASDEELIDDDIIK